MMLLGVPPQGPRDALREMQKKAEKQAIEKNYRELREAARELADQRKRDRAKGSGLVIKSGRPAR
jgi:hypothetical protein